MISRTQLTNVADKAAVAIVGGGPAGLLIAYQAAQNDVNVVVLEKRESYSREHSVKLESRSFQAAQADEKLNALVQEWFGEKTEVSIPIQQLERDLEKLLPKNVQILRGVEFVSSENTDKSDTTVQIRGISELSHIFKKAHVIVGADGANSLIQQEISGSKKSETLLQHTLLVKLLTEKKPSNQNFLARTLTMAKCGRVFHEHIGKMNQEGLYPVTAQMVIDESEYLAVQHGTFKNPLAMNAIIPLKLKKSISLWLHERIQKPQAVKIIPVPLKTFIAPKLASKKIGQPVVLIGGDAAGYMPYFKAVNKGIEGALQLGIAMRTHFRNPSSYFRSTATVSKPFKEYETKVRSLLEQAIQESDLRAAKIRLGDSSVISSGKLMGSSGFDVAGRTQTSWDVADSIGRFATVLFKGFRSLLPF